MTARPPFPTPRKPRLVVMEKVYNPKGNGGRGHLKVRAVPSFAGPRENDEAFDRRNFRDRDFHSQQTLTRISRVLPRDSEVDIVSSLLKKGGFWAQDIKFLLTEIMSPEQEMMAPGDILLVELQIRGRFEDKFGNAPIELDPSNQAALAAAAEKGIIVIEPAGNGFPNGKDKPYVGVDLASVVWPEDNSRGITGENAICVGACTDDGERLPTSNFGQAVVCCGAGPLGTIDGQTYGGTSAAAAWLAAVAWQVQNRVMATDRPPLSLAEMRATLTSSGVRVPALGVKPDLNTIIGNLR